MRLNALVLVALFAPGMALEAQAAPRLQASLERAIGDGWSETRDGYFMSDIRGISLDVGRIAVASYKENNIRVFDEAGALLYTIGQPGEGPGDLRGPCCLTIDPTGRLWVSERGNLRFSVFRLGKTSATYLWSVRMPATPSGRFDRLAFDASKNPIYVASVPAADGKRLSIRMTFDSAGMVLKRDTVARPAAEIPTARIMGKSGSTTVGQPFGPTILEALGPGGETAVALSTRYAVAWMTPTGARFHSIERDVKGPLVTVAERDREEAVLTKLAKDLGVERTAIPFDIPVSKAPLRRIGFDLEGRLWIERATAAGKPNEADVFDRSGKLVYTLEWPRNTTLTQLAVRGLRGAGMETDSLGGERLVILRWKP